MPWDVPSPGKPSGIDESLQWTSTHRNRRHRGENNVGTQEIYKQIKRLCFFCLLSLTNLLSALPVCEAPMKTISSSSDGRLTVVGSVRKGPSHHPARPTHWATRKPNAFDCKGWLSTPAGEHRSQKLFMPLRWHCHPHCHPEIGSHHQGNWKLSSSVSYWEYKTAR